MTVTYIRRGEIAWITLNRPEKRNAIDDATLAALERAVRRAAEEKARAAVIGGEGPCFSAGLDLAEHRSRTPLEVFSHSRRWHEVFTAIRRGPVPTLAALHGAVIGGGLELAAACHLRVADETAFFALPEGQRGIYVGGGASVFVARLIGAARMADMMLTSRVLSAAEAERAGLVNYRVAAGGAAAKAGELAERIATMAPATVIGILDVLPRIQDMAESDGLLVESLMAALAQSAPEAGARLEAFVAKRGAKVAAPRREEENAPPGGRE